MFKLTELETFIPEYLFLHICLKECGRSGRTSRFIHVFLLPPHEAGRKPQQNPTKTRTKTKHSPALTSFWSGCPQTFT